MEKYAGTRSKGALKNKLKSWNFILKVMQSLYSFLDGECTLPKVM